MVCCGKLVLVAGGAVAAGVLASLLWALARRRFIYPGGNLAPDLGDPVRHGLPRSGQVWLETEDSVRIHAWWTPADPVSDAAARVDRRSPSPAAVAPRGAVIYCHGNAESMATRAWIARRVARLGLDILLFDYRGYGLSEGRPSEEGLARDARAAWRYVVGQREIPSDRVVIMGHSLGSAVAARLALSVDQGPAGLVLGSPFPSMPDVFASHAPWLPALALRWGSDRYEGGSRLSELQAPVMVLIGLADTVIPPELSFEVLEAAPESSTLVSVPADHGTVMGHADVWDALGTFLEDVVGS